jgi:hypothetical protein
MIGMIASILCKTAMLPFAPFLPQNIWESVWQKRKASAQQSALLALPIQTANLHAFLKAMVTFSNSPREKSSDDFKMTAALQMPAGMSRA